MTDQRIPWLFAHFSCSMTFHVQFHFQGFPGFPVSMGTLLYSMEIYTDAAINNVSFCSTNPGEVMHPFCHLLVNIQRKVQVY